MAEPTNADGDAPSLLGPYRVLDLTDARGHLCGKILGEMGADVIKVEPPGGDPARDVGPFVDDTPDRNGSLSWFAYNSSKRGITLNLESEQGRALLKRLVAGADFFLESFNPGYLDSLGLGYGALKRMKPDLVMTSVTPFGQDGPYRDYEASDLTLMAIGGLLAEHAHLDSPPVRMSVDQAYSHGGAYGAAATLAAHYRRLFTGEGQHVDVSIQECITQMFTPLVQDWFLGTRIGATWSGTAITRSKGLLRGAWACRDGYVIYRFTTGFTARRTHVIFQWAEEDGLDTEGLKDVRFTEVDTTTATQEDVDRWMRVLETFFARHTIRELVDGAFQRRMMIYPVNTVKDLLEDRQLTARGFFTEVEHPELGRALTYPGAWWQGVGPKWQSRGRAPLVGEHNEAVYMDELGLNASDLARLVREGIV